MDTQTYEIVFDRVVLMIDAWDEDHAILIAEQEMGDLALSWEGPEVR